MEIVRPARRREGVGIVIGISVNKPIMAINSFRNGYKQRLSSQTIEHIFVYYINIYSQ